MTISKDGKSLPEILEDRARAMRAERPWPEAFDASCAEFQAIEAEEELAQAHSEATEATRGEREIERASYDWLTMDIFDAKKNMSEEDAIAHARSLVGDDFAHNVTELPPTGLGFYIRDLTRYFRAKWPPKKLAKYLADHGTKHAYLLACWQDHKGHREFNEKHAPAYAEALAAAGIRVGLWGFPRPDMLGEYVESFAERTQACGGGTMDGGPISTWLHDPELPWKVKGAKQQARGLRGQGEAIKGDGIIDSFEELQDAAEDLTWLEGQARQYEGVPDVGWTSYGMAKWHRIPYAEFLARFGWGSPQLYSVSPAQVRQGLAQWRELGAQALLPSVPVFGKNSGARLTHHLNAFVPQSRAFDDEGSPVEMPKIGGVVVWSFHTSQIQHGEMRQLHAFAERQGWA